MVNREPTAEESETLQRHYVYLHDLGQKGILLQAGRTTTGNDAAFGIAIIRAATEDEARKIMNDDPAVHEGIMSAELFPYRVAIVGRGWEPTP